MKFTISPLPIILFTVFVLMDSIAVLLSLQPVAFIHFPCAIDVLSTAIELSFKVLSLIFITKGVFMSALPVILPILKPTSVFSPIRPCLLPKTILIVVFKLSFIGVAVWPRRLSFPMH